MESPFETVSFWDLGRPVSPNPYRHARNFSDQSILSVSSYGSDMSHISLNVPSGGLSRANSHRKPPKQRLTKLIKSSLKHTLKSNNADSSNIEFWNAFYKKLRKIINAFNDPLSLYDALNDPYSGKSSSKTCSSLIHILCKQLYLYSRSSNWNVCFKIWDAILFLLENGANTSIFYTKSNETPQKNYNSIHTLYQGLTCMLNGEVITNKQFVNYFSQAISAGNDDIHTEFIMRYIHESRLTESTSMTSLPSISTHSSDGNTDGNTDEDSNNISQHTKFDPCVLTLCIYKQYDESDDWEWQNITYWLGDCLYHDYYVNLISPHLAKGFIMMGYDLLGISLQKLDHLNFALKDKITTIITDHSRIKEFIHNAYYEDIQYNGDKIHHKIVAFLWFIRFGNFKNDLIDLMDIGIKQLARNQFQIDHEIIQHILQYSHYFVMSSSQSNNNNNMDKLILSYFNEDEWMMTAWEILFKLDNIWIDWIGQYVIPQLTKDQINKIKHNLSQNVTDKQWNKFIRRINLNSINSFCVHDIFGEIDTNKMQSIILKNYTNPDLIPIIINANYDIEQTWGNSSILYKILNDDTMDNTQIDPILDAIHKRIQDKGINGDDGEQKDNNNNNSGKLIINELLFGVVEWQINQSIWRNILLVFNTKYKYFRNSLCELFYELTTEQNADKFIFFMKHNLIDFNYCLYNDGLIESGLQTLIDEKAFDKQASCIQLIGDWIYKHFENEKDDIRKKEIATKMTNVITSNMTSDDSHLPRNDREHIIIERYLDQLKSGLSR